MFAIIWTALRCLCSGFQSRHQLVLENLALRHQLAVLARSVRKPKLRSSDRFLWVLLRRFWSGWHHSLVMVVPRTVVGWHRLDFRLFWRWKSRARGGRPSMNRELIGLIGQMWSSNPTWGSKRVQAELAKLVSPFPIPPSANTGQKPTPTVASRTCLPKNSNHLRRFWSYCTCHWRDPWIRKLDPRIPCIPHRAVNPFRLSRSWEWLEIDDPQLLIMIMLMDEE